MILVMLFGMANNLFAHTDTVGKASAHPLSDSIATNVYMTYNHNILRRNIALYCVPSLYTIARGDRFYEGETFGRMKIDGNGNLSVSDAVYSGNMSSYRRTMPTLLRFLSPRLYNEELFPGEILSPFNAANEKFYKYKYTPGDSITGVVVFKPRISNTQLVNGYAIVNSRTGKVITTSFNGEYDMLSFNAKVGMGTDSIPDNCRIRSYFSFLGNRVTSEISADYSCPDSLRDRVEHHRDVQNVMEAIHNNSDDTTKAESERILDSAWDFMGNHLLSKKKAEISELQLSMSPLINPLSLSYSHSRGLSYSMDFSAHYAFTPSSCISIDPTVGYNFKIKQLFVNIPLRYTFNTRRNTWIELTWANGNRISDSGVLDMIKDERRDTIDFDALELNYFKDEMLSVVGNTSISYCFDISAGVIYHRREAVNSYAMSALGKPTTYNSFAPMLKIAYTPYHGGPTFTGIFTRSINGILRSNMEFEKYEFDASYKKRLRGLRGYSLRLGGGFYTNMTTTYFIDFVNFHENYLSGGWDDDWTGQFQLLNSAWYNASKYYIRMNASYESPLMTLSRLPLIGKHIETERLYLSALQIEHMGPYVELGYGFTTRFFSFGLFMSAIDAQVFEVGGKMTFELFRRW